MEVLNHKREFELHRMDESETVKDYSDRLMKTVNRIKVSESEITDKRIVEKELVSLPEKFEHKISSLEDFKDLSQISLNESVNALRPVEQRKTLRLENKATEGAFLASEKEKS